MDRIYKVFLLSFFLFSLAPSPSLKSAEAIEIPNEIRNLINLEELDFKSDSIIKFSDEMKHLINLKHLDIKCNAVIDFPKEILNITK